jgi:hypothetical protein
MCFRRRRADADPAPVQQRRLDGPYLGISELHCEGIDTLETHFENQHQDLTHAVAARDRMLELVGFGQVEFWPDLPNKIKTAEHHPIRATCWPTASKATAASWAWSTRRH